MHHMLYQITSYSVRGWVMQKLCFAALGLFAVQFASDRGRRWSFSRGVELAFQAKIICQGLCI